MATHGKINPDNCHPFHVVDDVYFIHNGILNIEQSLDPNKSDTYHFAELVLKPMLERLSTDTRRELIRSASFRYLLEQAMGSGNKAVLFDSLGGVIFNKDAWHEMENGTLASSHSYPGKYVSKFLAGGFSDSIWDDEYSGYSSYKTGSKFETKVTPGSKVTLYEPNKIRAGVKILRGFPPSNIQDALEQAEQETDFPDLPGFGETPSSDSLDILEATLSDAELFAGNWIANAIPKTVEEFVNFYPEQAAKLLHDYAKIADVMYS